MPEILEATAVAREDIAYKNNRVVDSKTKETVKDLLVKVNWLIKCIESKPVVPILENILFFNGAIFSTTLATSAMYLTSIKGFFCFPAKKLLTILKTLDKSDVVSFNLVSENEIEVVVNGESIFGFDTEDPTDFPKVDKCDIVIAEFPDAQDIAQLVVVKDYTSNDQLRPAQCAVFMDNNNIVGTNGHWLSYKKCLSTIFNEDNFQVLFSQKAIDLISTFKHATVKRNTNNRYVMVKETNRAVVFNNIDEKYPDFKRVIPETNNVFVTISKKNLERAVNLALLASNKFNHQGAFTITHNSREINLRAEDNDFGERYSGKIAIDDLKWIPKEWTEVVNQTDQLIDVKHIEMLVPGETVFEIGFNLKFLQFILKSIEGDKVTMAMSAPNRAMVMNNDLLLMPVMLDRDL